MRFIRMADVGLEAAALEAASVLRQGGIVLYPTDTLYGLGVDAQHEEAVMRLCALKGRDAGKFISCVVPSIENIETYAVLSDEARRLAESFLPGPLTLALPAKATFPSALSWDGAVRIRIPDDAFVSMLGQVYERPYTSTSANISGAQTCATPEEILQQFGDRASDIALVISDGARSGGAPSTVVRVVEGNPEIVREGVLTAQVLGL